LAGAFVSFRAQRDVWFVVVVSLVIVAGALRSAPRERVRMTPGQLALATVLTGALVIGGGLVKDLSPRALEAAVRKEYPAAAATVVAERKYPGPLYNHYNWGGYLIWRLPDLQVSMDGRANVYGPERIRRSVETWSGLSGWDSDPDLGK